MFARRLQLTFCLSLIAVAIWAIGQCFPAAAETPRTAGKATVTSSINPSDRNDSGKPALPQEKKKPPDKPAQPQEKKKPPDKPAAETKPDGQKKGSSDQAQVLDPGQFFGEAAIGYASAKACPDICAKLFCYCGCDITDSHTNLLDCFTSYHGVDCHICQEEAVLALRLHRDGVPLEEIQKKVDMQYSSQYPFEQDTPAYKKYKATRLWKKSDEAPPSSDAGKASGGRDPDSKAQDDKDAQPKATPSADGSKTPKVKPGFHVGNCCKGDKHPGSDKHVDSAEKPH